MVLVQYLVLQSHWELKLPTILIPQTQVGRTCVVLTGQDPSTLIDQSHTTLVITLIMAPQNGDTKGKKSLIVNAFVEMCTSGPIIAQKLIHQINDMRFHRQWPPVTRTMETPRRPVLEVHRRGPLGRTGQTARASQFPWHLYR